MFGREQQQVPHVYTAPSPADAYHTGAVEQPGRFNMAHLSFKHKAIVAAGAAATAAAVIFGPNIVDEIHDQWYASEYMAPDWAVDDVGAPGIWGKEIALAVQDDQIASKAIVGGIDQVNVNVFQTGIEGDNGELIAPFENMTGIDYGVMFAISRGNPEFVLEGTTGGILPVKNADAEQVAIRLGLADYSQTNVQAQAVVFNRVMNDKAAALWALNASAGVYRDAPTPQLEQEAWMKDTLAAYVASLELKSGGTPLTADQVTKIASVIYKLAADYKAQDSPTFNALVSPADEAAKTDIQESFKKAEGVALQWVGSGKATRPVLSDGQQDIVDKAQKANRALG
jgi:hypothetical protein